MPISAAGTKERGLLKGKLLLWKTAWHLERGGGEGSETNLVPLLRGVAGLLVKGGLGPICHMVEAGTSFQFMELLMDGKRNYGTVVIPPYSFQVVGINNCTCPLLYLNWYCLWCVCFIFGLCQLII